MSLQQVWEIAGAILVSLGGGGAIVVGLSSWLGKVWANRILENEKSAHNKELEDYKNRLQTQLSKLEAQQDKALYVSKAQYDNEYSIYREIWAKMHECIVRTSMLYPKMENTPTDETEREQYHHKKYTEYVEAYNIYSATINNNAPFYREDFYCRFIEVRDLCSGIGRTFSLYEFEVKHSASFAMARDSRMDSEEKREVYIDFPKQIKTLEDELRIDIKKYLSSLQLGAE